MKMYKVKVTKADALGPDEAIANLDEITDDFMKNRPLPPQVRSYKNQIQQRINDWAKQFRNQGLFKNPEVDKKWKFETARILKKLSA